MKKSRILSAAVSLSMLLSGISFTASAVTFNDVDNDPTVSWAKTSINKMTDAGYIKGYEDGTFKPYNAISKIECLLLMARMLGFENKEYSEIVDLANEKYGEVAEKYNKKYAKELSYLLYNGVLYEKDLSEYASAAQSNTSLLRCNAAVLMAKLIGADEEASKFTVSKPTYADDAAIPSQTKPYVEYVTKEGIMNGMDKTEAGEPQFSPVTTLTRAQMATLLARLMDRLDIDYVEGKLDEVKNEEITIDGDKLAINSATSVYSDGELISAKELIEGDSVKAVKACGAAYAVVTTPSEEVTTVYGVVVRKNENSEGRKITIADYEDAENSATYMLRSNCTIKTGSSKASFSDIMADDFVKVEITGGKASAISTEDTKFDVSGKLVSIEADDNDHVYLNVSDKDGENVQNYVVSSKGAVVARDGEEVEFRDLSVGDTVTLRLTYGKVTRVTAQSTTEKFSGLLSEIIISSEPAITITSNGESNTYKLRSDVKITVAGTAGDIYDLRPNITVSGTLDSSEVKTLTAATVATNDEGEMVGKVTGKNTTYSVITIEDEDGNTQRINYNSKTTFLTRTGSNTNAKAIEIGADISVVGAEKNGVFEATIIIIK